MDTEIEELWKPVKDAHYEVSNLGRIRNTETLRVLKISPCKNGYCNVSFYNNFSVEVHWRFHRLIATVWLPNPDNLPQVNHKDGCKHNNAVSNLEWMTGSANMIHATENELAFRTVVWLTDLTDSSKTKFRSMEFLSKSIGIDTTTLMSFAKNSDRYPIRGRYIVTIENEDVLLESPVGLKCGRPVYVYDAVTGKSFTYPSTKVASYHTGLRNLKRQLEESDPLYKIGYFLTRDKNINVDCSKFSDVQTLIGYREEYLSIPCRGMPSAYYVYDYYSKEEVTFSTVDDMATYLSIANKDGVVISKNHCISTLAAAMKRNRTALIKGYGIRSNLHPAEWTPYHEEEIVASIHGIHISTRTYIVTVNGNNSIIFGIRRLAKYLNYGIWRLSSETTHEDLLKASSIPGLKIKRLNSPIP